MYTYTHSLIYTSKVHTLTNKHRPIPDSLGWLAVTHTPQYKHLSNDGTAVPLSPQCHDILTMTQVSCTCCRLQTIGYQPGVAGTALLTWVAAISLKQTTATLVHGNRPPSPRNIFQHSSSSLLASPTYVKLGRQYSASITWRDDAHPFPSHPVPLPPSLRKTP